MLALLSLLALPTLASASSICYDYYGRAYYCNGLSSGARIGIGIGIAVGVLLLFSLCGYWRRRQLRSQWSKYRPPALPTQNQSGNYNPSNPYANNPPPPQNAAAYSYGNSQWENNNNVQAPPATYQPSMAGQYTGAGNGTGYKEVNAQGTGVTGMGSEHEHGYEWEQAREAERLEREQQQQGGGAPPPGYNVNVDPTNGYAPPSGAPPTGKHTGGVV